LYLTRFINSIISTPIFQRSPYVIAFLNDNNTKTFNDIKKRGTKERRPTSLEQFYSLTPDIPINTDVPDMRFMQGINDFLSLSEVVQRKLKRQTGGLLVEFRKVGDGLEGIADLVHELEKSHALVPEASAQRAMFGELANILDEWAAFEKKQVRDVNDNLTTFFKFYYK
jgi:hypothetical protein